MAMQAEPDGRAGRAGERRAAEGDAHTHPTPTAPLARLVGRTRFAVLLAVAAVLLVAVALFVLGAGLALVTIWNAGQAVLRGDFGSTFLTVEFLEIVSTMLKAVVFYIIGIGLYGLFIAPLNLPTALGMETLHDLEAKVVSVIIVILAISFLEHFILWQRPNDILVFGVTMALVVPALVLFQFYCHWAKEKQSSYNAVTQVRARRELFHQDEEEREIESVAEASTEAEPRAARRPLG